MNPAVIEIAKRYFTFLRDSKSQVQIIPGDGRVSLENELPQDFDILILDAFRGASIPTHLLTVEAFAVYLRHLRRGGTLVVNVSNAHLNLMGVVWALAKNFRLHGAVIETRSNVVAGTYSCDYALLARDLDWLQDREGMKRNDKSDLIPAGVGVWRDDYSSLIEVMNWR